MLKLYGLNGSACTRKVQLVLAEKGLDYELVPVDLAKGEHKQPEHLARHPFGVVPVLQDGDLMLYESDAIMRYLDRAYGGVALVPAEPEAQARMEQAMSVEYAYLRQAVGTLFRENYLKRFWGQAADAEAVAREIPKVEKVLAVLDAWLADRTYVAGGDYSLADLHYALSLLSLKQAGLLDLVKAYPNVGRWYGAVMQRGAYQALAA
jgi:glutathione S-transferase